MKHSSATGTHKNEETEKHSTEINADMLAGIRRLPSREVRDLILGALKAGVRHRTTKKGIMLYGENGNMASVHFGSSDRKAFQRVTRDLRALGYDPGRK